MLPFDLEVSYAFSLQTDRFFLHRLVCLSFLKDLTEHAYSLCQSKIRATIVSQFLQELFDGHRLDNEESMAK